MDKDDKSYDIMLKKRAEYVVCVKDAVKKMGMKFTEFELEEIEASFEFGFAQGYIAAIHNKTGKELN